MILGGVLSLHSLHSANDHGNGRILSFRVNLLTALGLRLGGIVLGGALLGCAWRGGRALRRLCVSPPVLCGY